MRQPETILHEIQDLDKISLNAQELSFQFPNDNLLRLNMKQAEARKTILLSEYEESLQYHRRHSSMDTEERKKKRLLLLKELYDKAEGNANTGIKPLSLGNYDEGALSYLIGEELVSKGRSISKYTPTTYSITHKGIKEIEQAHDNPAQPSTYFPPYGNVINIQNMNHSAIQQGTHNSSQTFTLTNEDSEDVKSILNELNEIKEKLERESENYRVLEAHITTIQAQIDSPKPSSAILSATLSVVENFLLGVNVSLYTPVVKEAIERLIK